MNPKTGEVATYDPNSIKPAVGHNPAKEKLDVKKSPQFLAREEIARRREAERQEEITEANAAPYDILNDDGSITPGKAIETAPEVPETEKIPETPVEPEAPAPEVKEEPPAKEPAPEETRTLVVDGKSIEVPLSKIMDAGIRTFQKETAADMRLAAASQLEQQARERLQQTQPKEQPEFAQKPQVSEDDAALAHAIQFGTEDQAKDAIAKLRNAGRGSPQEVQGLVQKHVMNVIPEVMKFHDANNWVRNEYKEIFADPMLEQQFMLSENARRQNGDARPHRELYKELADTMLTKFHLRDGTEAPPATPTEGTDRMIRKANSPRPVQAAGGQKAPAPAARQPTVTDFVERQRALRGLAPMPRKDQSI